MNTRVDHDKRRILRIVQVREQSKDIAKKLRCRVNFEKNKQISLAAAEKEKQFKNLKSEFLNNLKSNHKNYLSSVGNSHFNVQNENQELEEWKNQKKYQILKAQQRGDKASKTLKESKTLEKNKKLSTAISNKTEQTKSALRLTTPEKIKKLCDTDHIPSNNKDILTCACETILIPCPASEENKMHDNKFDDVLKKSKMTLNPDEILNNNVEECKSQFFENPAVKKTETLKHINKIESDQPIDFVSHYIKNRDTVPSTENKDKKGDLNSQQLESVRETIEHSKQFSTEYNDSFQDPILKLQEKGVIDSESADIQNKNYKKKPCLITTIANDKTNVPIFTCFRKDSCKCCKTKKNFTCFKKKNQYGSIIFKPKDKYNINSSYKKQWEPPRWQIGEKKKDSYQKILKSYDYNNKFKKNIVIDNSEFIERLRIKSPNAFQNAKDEIERMTEIVNSTKRINESRKKNAIAKMKIENDYKKLLNVLEKFSRRKANETKMSIIQNEIPSEIDFEHLNPENHENSKTSNNPGKFQEVALNVATWSPFSENDLTEKNNYENGPLKDSDDSSKSAIFIANSHVNKNNDSSIEENNNIKKQKIMPEKSIKLNTSASKNNSDNLNGQYNTDSSNVINNIQLSNYKSDSLINEDNQTKKIKSIKRKTKHKNKCKPDINIEQLPDSNHNVFTPSKQSFSFEGVQVVIEIKKKENKSTQIVTMKDNKIQTIKDSSSSSQEISMQTSKTVYNGNIACTKMGSHSVYKSDTSSESTVYMRLPDKMTKNVNKNASDKNVKMQLENSLPTKLFENNTSINVTSKNKIRPHKGKQIVTQKMPLDKDQNILDQKLKNNSNLVDDNPHLPIHKKGEIINFKENLTDTKLKKYIKTLLALSNNEMENVNINVSDITTPNSSVINTLPNTSAVNVPHHIMDKLEKLEVFLQNNYALLEELKDDHYMNSKWKHLTKKKHITNNNKNTENVPNVSTTSKEKNKKLNSTKIKENEVKNSYQNSTDSLSFGVTHNFDLLSKLDKELLHERETNDKKSNSTKKRDSQELIEECNQRISILSDMLVQLRKEKHSIKTPSNSDSLSGLENETTNMETSKHKDTSVKLSDLVDYVPILTNIPKPDITHFNTHDHKNNEQHLFGKITNDFITSDTKTDFANEYIHCERPVALSTHRELIPDESYFTFIPHELSTIIEVDTPKTTKSSSTLLKTYDAIPIIPFNKNPSFANFSKNKNETIKHTNNINIDVNQSEQCNDNQSQKSQSILNTPNSEEGNINATYQPFFSFDDYLKINKTSNEDKNQIAKSSDLNKYTMTLPSSEMIQSNTGSSLSHKREHSGSDTSGNFSAELDTILKDAGVNWGISTMKKTKNSTLLASDSSQSTQNLYKPAKDKASAHSSDSSNVLSEDLQICYETFKKFSIEDLSKLSLNKELKMILDYLEKDNTAANDKKYPAANTISTNIGQVKSNHFNANQSKLLMEHASNSKDKTQPRTSTPVEKSSKSSNTISSKNNSNGLFSIDSELSSVKNLSTSDKNTSNDNGTLSIPNFRLVFPEPKD